ncbi:NADH-quinone oxidoreductase subunit L [Neoehrlichia mikurensis]|uniref:NADH-quinone oxidoreductase subunit L n=1 Tax=Neoehrlichia mikurensis TaxID=89586 RepID=A0A9Q9BWV0_9RICK|nr:NADH-quinone oxidoreductase subunit L [Neoehrlichia mikurensis]QXK91998.1 NADH-quinone oxidoreductase subunit L [Neoehrlichia mikurensis]QXK93691.1 NADH-quinone oxidoreductase subunit L [Neoehrlichia mikurensis]UTO55336.1 NADH-quinone oxidoreductase subunit L [Neoehrlichia mikurensis]
MITVELLCVFLPLIGSILCKLVNKKLFSQILASCGVIVSTILSWYLFFSFQKSYNINIVPWIYIDALQVNWSIYIDRLTVMMLIIVTTISSVVHLYSIGYMSHDKSAIRFSSYLSLFTFFMLMLVTSGNFLQLFFGWEGVGLCSYLLIGFWFNKLSAIKAAVKAFIVNRIGDFFFILGILLIFVVFNTLDFVKIFHYVNTSTVNYIIYAFGHQITIYPIHIICILLFIGCMGKSAQIGLHTWLPDAMEGPTPASALIHAATMVTAGVFLVAKCSPLFELSQPARDLIILIGGITCFFAATVAIVQDDIKKIIAYSTCSQLGYMFIACGASAYNIAIFHLMTHAFFKSLLFLCAGNIIHSMKGEQQISNMSGNSWKKIPYTYLLTWIGSLALAGIFPFAGFYSKDLIIESSYHVSIFSFVIGNIVAFLTACYSWKLVIMVFHGAGVEDNSIHESKYMMLIPLLVLAVGSMISGMLAEHFISTVDFWKDSIIISHHHEVELFIKYLPLICGIMGIIAAYLIYFCQYYKYLHFKILYVFLCNKWYFDKVYNYAITKPVKKLSYALWMKIDKKFIDYFCLGGITRAVIFCARYTTKIQTGYVFDYAFVMLLGLIGIVMYFIYNIGF